MTDLENEEIWPRAVRIIIHLHSGEKFESLLTGELSNKATKKEVEELESLLKDLLKTSGGWQINIETESGWAIFPKESVNYVEYVFDN